MQRDIIDSVIAAGLEVWMRNEDDTWMIFTDGTRLGYLQADRHGHARPETAVHSRIIASSPVFSPKRNFLPEFAARKTENTRAIPKKRT